MCINQATAILRAYAARLALALLACMIAHASLALEADSDIPGSADYQLLRRYPHSHIVQYDSASTVEPYTLILGSIKKVNNVVSPEAEREIEGVLTRITYRIPDGRTSDEVYEHFRDELEAEGAEFLFTCRGRDCGGSNYWANRIFNMAILYGPEQYQNYLVARASLEGQEQFISVYTLQRGNRRLYAHIEIVSATTDTTIVEGEAILTTLLGSGRYPLVGVDFDDQGVLLGTSERVLQDVAEALNEDPDLNLYVVGHLDREGPLDELLAESKRRAQLIVDRLIARGVAASRLTPAGVGPLAPTAGLSGERVELVMQ